MIFNIPEKYRYFNELEIDGQNMDEDDEDYTQDADNTPEDDTTADDDADNIENVEDDDDDDTDYTTDEPDTDYTEEIEDDPDEGEEDTPTEGEEEDAPTEDQSAEDDTGTDDEGGEDDLEGLDDTDDVDYTDEAPADDENPEGDEGEDTGADEGDNTDDTSEDDTGGEEDTTDGDQSLADMEKNLFSDMTPAQLSIKNAELLQNYIDMYDSLNVIFDNINKIPKTYNNTRAIEFVANKVVELKDMVNYIITTTYVTKTYIENLTTYKHCLLILQQTNTMLKGLVQKQSK